MEDFIFGSRSYYFAALCLIVFAIFLFVFVFEKRKPKARELVLLSVLIALTVISRMIFFMTPQMKPMAALIIITAVALGKEAGFLCGAVALFLSNMFFGQGPWTPWQMFAFGVVGFLAGVLFHRRFEKNTPGMKEVIALCIYGVSSILLIYGPIMDTATVLMYTDRPTLAAFVSAYVAGIVFNLIHGISTGVVLALLCKPMIRKINRVRVKFGMFL